MKMPRARTLLTLTTMWLVLAACGTQQPGGEGQNLGPVASFSVAPSQGEAPLTVTLDASGSSDADGQVQSYAWDLGDGTSATGVTTQHTYGAGTFTVRLTVTDDRGATGSAERSVTVTGAATSGSISGTITPGFSGTALPAGSAAAAAVAARSWSLDESLLDFVPGEVIVKFEPSVARSLTTMRVNGVGMSLARSIPEVSIGLYRAAALGKAETLALARELGARADVLYAHPNYRFHALAVPDDAAYPYQWHYPAINLPQAWDITTGAASTVVGVVDTGILFKTGDPSLSHPDLAGRVLPGYDFVSDPAAALDGDGRDGDPFDELHADNSFHGSHVAGTIGAATDNQIGVAGVDWHAQIVPVRALAGGTGTLVDIYEGLLWVTGFSVDGVPDNPNPATVVNMSLGGAGTCLPAVQDVLDTVMARAIVVVAAGNENQNAAEVSPANCSGVITVGATDFAGARAPYSNFGSRIDVMAPGGDTSADLNTDGEPDGVLSLNADLQAEQFSLRFLNGTSMAAPHVAGVVSLMKALDPELTGAEALAALRATARPLSATACERPTAGECGAGLIDAFAALQAVEAGDATPPVGGTGLSFAPELLDFGAADVELDVVLTNEGDTSVNWQLSHFEDAPDNPSELPDGAIYLPDGAVAGGTLAAGQSVTTSLGVDRSLVTADGLYQVAVIADVDGVAVPLAVRFRKGSSEAPSMAGPMIVSAFIPDEAGTLVLSGSQVSDGVITDYRFDALPGANTVAAWSDENGNGTVDEGDFFGVHAGPVVVEAGAETADVGVTVELVIDASALAPFEAERVRLEHALR